MGRPGDDRDLGNRALTDSLVPLMDKLDAAEREALASVAEKDRAARQALDAKGYRLAATLFRECAVACAAALGSYHHRAVDYERRALDCDSLADLSRRKRK